MAFFFAAHGVFDLVGLTDSNTSLPKLLRPMSVWLRLTNKLLWKCHCRQIAILSTVIYLRLPHKQRLIVMGNGQLDAGCWMFADAACCMQTPRPKSKWIALALTGRGRPIFLRVQFRLPAYCLKLLLLLLLLASWLVLLTCQCKYKTQAKHKRKHTVLCTLPSTVCLMPSTRLYSLFIFTIHLPSDKRVGHFRSSLN